MSSQNDPREGKQEDHERSTWVPPEDLTATWEARRSTSQLLGIYIRETRRQYELTVEVLAHAADRTQEWLRSLERGEFVPTEEMIEDVQNGLARSTSSEFQLLDAYLDLLGDPTSDLACSLRSRVPASDLNIQDDDPDAVPSASTIPIGSGLSFFDRVLVVSPIAIGLLLAATVGGFAAWADGRSAGGLLTVRWVTFIGFVALTSTAFLVPTLNLLFRPLTWLVRLPTRSKAKDLPHWSDTYGTPRTTDTVWTQPGFSPHLLPKYRSDAIDVGLSADFAERMTVIFGSVFCFALWLCTSRGVFDLPLRLSTNTVTLSRLSALAISLLTLGLLTVASAITASKCGRSAHATISDGLGVQPDAATAADSPRRAPANDAASSQRAP